MGARLSVLAVTAMADSVESVRGGGEAGSLERGHEIGRSQFGVREGDAAGLGCVVDFDVGLIDSVKLGEC
jgi:hypothetical protein